MVRLREATLVPTRLEGMETRELMPKLLKRSLVPTRLEGMETSPPLVRVSRRRPSRPDLRGWKLDYTIGLVGGRLRPDPT